MPPVNPKLNLESPPLSATFSVLPTQKAFLKNCAQSLSQAQNQTTLFCSLWLAMNCRQLLISSSRTSYLRTFRRSSSSCLRSSSMHLLASMYSCRKTENFMCKRSKSQMLTLIKGIHAKSHPDCILVLLS